MPAYREITGIARQDNGYTMIKHSLIFFSILFMASTVLAAEPVDLSDETAQISYSLGYQIGGDFKRQGVNIDATAVIQGIEDALADNEPQLSLQQMTALLVALKQKVVAVQQRELMTNTKEFMDANRKKEGIMELPSGSQYRVISKGDGPSPDIADKVDIHYITRRTDGTQIATTYSEPIPRTYEIRQMLPGLQEALLKMNRGARWEIFVPPGSGGRKEAMVNSGVLIYEVELIAIHPANG